MTDDQRGTAWHQLLRLTEFLASFPMAQPVRFAVFAGKSPPRPGRRLGPITPKKLWSATRWTSVLEPFQPRSP